ncbi:MAG: pyridoxal-phosphate dependent enzyme [Pyrinomonadaceae bacterium]
MKALLEAIRPTSFITSEKLSSKLGIELLIASETFQHTGSFKFRAAYNVALNVPEQHLIASSSGNFGQALAYACKLLGKRCHVVMPDTSAKVKVEAVRNYGAVADLIDVSKIGREERVAQLMNEFPDAYRASPFDDPLVIDGNATLGSEIADHDDVPDYVIAPIGGGGLISGISEGLKKAGSKTVLLGAEPLMANDAARSLKAGKIIRNDFEPQTIADGARTLALGKYNWAIIKEDISEIIEVSDEKIKEALRLYFGLANLKVEPTAAVSLGAVILQKERFAGKKVCCIVSGGNVDSTVYSSVLNG